MRYLVLSLLLSGCATTGAYEKVLQSWVGKPKEKLYKSWGMPTKESGNMVLYSSRNGGSVAYGNYNEWWCNTTFFISEAGTIQTWQWEGNDCTAKASLW